MPQGDVNIKPIALGLAAGVFIDAFLVRMTLVPAVMTLLGDKAWWIPGWLDRLLPSIDIEGEGIRREITLRDWPEHDLAIAARGLVLEGAQFAGTIDASIPKGSLVAVTGDPLAVRTALLTLTGRHAIADGDVKIHGYLLPERSAAARRVAAFCDGRTMGPAEIRRLGREKPRIIAVDDASDLSSHAATFVREASAKGITVIAGLRIGDPWLLGRPPEATIALNPEAEARSLHSLITAN